MYHSKVLLSDKRKHALKRSKTERIEEKKWYKLLQKLRKIQYTFLSRCLLLEVKFSLLTKDNKGQKQENIMAVWKPAEPFLKVLTSAVVMKINLIFHCMHKL